jgi:hypothetical protein
MWAYRLGKADDSLRLLKPFSALRKWLLRQHEVCGDETETLFQLDNDLKVARNMARALGWDTSLACPEQCFSMPGPDSTLYGFVITQATSGQRYVVSPVELAYLTNEVDWDARINEAEVRKVRGELSGTVVDRPPLRVGEWKRSAKGNMWTTINGANCTVFAKNDGTGYCAVIMNPTSSGLKVYTRAFETELECANYVIQADNFYNLIRGWLGSPGEAKSTDLDSPFADIDWEGEDERGLDPDIPF